MTIQKSFFTKTVLASVLIMLLAFSINSDEIDIQKSPFFNHTRLAQYMKELEVRRKMEPKNIELAIRLYRIYFLAEEFVKAHQLINEVKKIYKENKVSSIRTWLAIDFDELKSLIYSYQFRLAYDLGKKFVKTYSEENPDLCKSVSDNLPRLLANSKLPSKARDGSDSIWRLETKLMSNLSLPIEDSRLSVDGQSFYVKKKDVWYVATLVDTFFSSSSKPAVYQKLTVKDFSSATKAKQLFPIFGTTHIVSGSDSSLEYSYPYLKPKGKKKVEERREIEVFKSSQSDLSCKTPYLSPEMDFWIASCKHSYPNAPYDLYFIRLNGDKKNKPERLPISSNGDDLHPVISPDGRFVVFSSDGHPGYGGFDLFIAPIVYIKEKGGLGSSIPRFNQPAENLGPAFNSYRDELAINGIISGGDTQPTRLLFYYQTQAKGLGFYTAELPKKYRSANVFFHHVYIYDQDTKKRMQADISVIPQSEDDQRRKRVFASDETGKVLALQKGVKYFIKANKRGYLYFFDDLEITQKETNVELLQIRVGRSLTAKGIEFASNSSILKTEAEEAVAAVVDLLKENSNVRIRLEGHTSHIGAEQAKYLQASIRLSEDRAFSVKKAMTKQGIYPKRIAIQGFGPNKPIPGIPIQDSRNRRTDVLVIDVNWRAGQELMPMMVFADFSAKNTLELNPFLGRSLPDALNTSMKDTGYVYKVLPDEKWKPNLRDILSGKMRRFCEVTGAEVVVYGQFETIKDKVHIYPHIYILNKDKVITIDKVITVNSSDMFNDIDTIAKEISNVLDNFSRK